MKKALVVLAAFGLFSAATPAMAQNQIYQHTFKDKSEPLAHHHITMVCGGLDDCSIFVLTMDCKNMVGYNHGDSISPKKQLIGAGSKAASECYRTYMIQPGTN